MDIAVCAMIDGMGKPHQPAHYQTIFLRLLQISISITSHSQFSNTLLVPMHCTVIRERRKSGQSNPPKINWGKNYVSQALSLKCPLYFRETCDDKMLSMNASKFDGIILSPKFRHVFVGKTLSYGWRLSSPQSSPHTIV